jgi:hypothetical protein
MEKLKVVGHVVKTGQKKGLVALYSFAKGEDLFIGGIKKKDGVYSCPLLGHIARYCTLQKAIDRFIQKYVSPSDEEEVITL